MDNFVFPSEVVFVYLCIASGLKRDSRDRKGNGKGGFGYYFFMGREMITSSIKILTTDNNSNNVSKILGNHLS